MSQLRFLLALWVSKIIALGIGFVAKDRGTNLPGAIALRMDPRFLSHFRGLDPEKMVLITGTNGKSTTTSMLYGILTQGGARVISNLGGANMTPGVAVPLLRNSSLLGRVRCDYVVLEVDERYVARIRRELPAKYLCVTNIMKDQVQRNGEPGFILDKLRGMITEDMTLILNGDEPNCLSLAGTAGSRAVTFGVEPVVHLQPEQDFFSVSVPCPVCHGGLRFQSTNLTHIGRYACPCCGFGNAATPDYYAHAISFAGQHFTVGNRTYEFHYANPQFLYSYVHTLATARELGIGKETIAAYFSAHRSQSDRILTRTVAGKPVHFFKVKQENSETVQDMASVIAAQETGKNKTLLFGMDEYIDFYPPYINTCFMFDCDFSYLKEHGVKKIVTMAPYEAEETALRFSYDGFPSEALEFLPGDSEAQLTAALQQEENSEIYLVEEVPFWNKGA